MSSWICYIRENYQVFDIAIKTIAVLGAIMSAWIALASIRIAKRKTQYEFFCDLYEDFHGDDILATKNDVALVWQSRFRQITSTSTSDEAEQRIPELADLADELIKDYLLQRVGVEFDDVDEQFIEDNKESIKKTKHILNKYEHLAKLIEAKVIHKKEIEIFFYTSLADTFVICLPFILYRRKSKPTYAHKMQALLKTFPALSRSWLRV
ncbi:MAG: hypothetical protein Q7U10_10700 [Thermodesulfovibrionia bacterium]|nr:hypothetical protein [Thermodesulfovibrionia bacterium]